MHLTRKPSPPSRPLHRHRRIFGVLALAIVSSATALFGPSFNERRVVDATATSATSVQRSLALAAGVVNSPPDTTTSPVPEPTDGPMGSTTVPVAPEPSIDTPTTAGAAKEAVAPVEVVARVEPGVARATEAEPAATSTAATSTAATNTAATSSAAAVRGSTVAGIVSRSGDQLVLDGAPYSFVGLNVYNANSRTNCWYTMRDAEIGAAIDASGADVLRVWFFQSLARDGATGTLDFRAFDETLASARSRGVRIVATLADHWGACEATGEKTTDWYRSGYRGSDGSPMPYRDYVAAVVARYANDPAVLSWQLVNEPESKDASRQCAADGTDVLRAFVADMTGLIRSIDPNHLISLGTIGSGQCGAQGDEYGRLYADGNLDWCELHDYNGAPAFGGDAWNGMDVRVEQCSALGLPVVVGEAGVSLEAAGSVDARAQVFVAKVSAGAARGVDGFLAWGWGAPPPGYGGMDDFALPPGDPALAALATARLR